MKVCPCHDHAHAASACVRAERRTCHAARGRSQTGTVADVRHSRVLRSCTGTPHRTSSVALAWARACPRMPTHAHACSAKPTHVCPHARAWADVRTASARGSRQTECIEGQLAQALPTYLHQLDLLGSLCDHAHSMRLAETLPTVCDTCWFALRIDRL